MFIKYDDHNPKNFLMIDSRDMKVELSISSFDKEQINVWFGDDISAAPYISLPNMRLFAWTEPRR